MPQLYTLGGLVDGEGFCLTAHTISALPIVSESAGNVFRLFREFGHVYRILEDCTTLQLVIASESAEEQGLEAPPEVRVSDSQQSSLSFTTRRYKSRRLAETAKKS